MNNLDYERDAMEFNKEVKTLLKGNVSDEDIVNYIAIKITKLYEQHIQDIRERSE